ncbi:MAG: AAA family ATPase [Anaerolineales bacterium]|nr:AAA family ATPase [Anaerolineales bacterium]
MSEETRQTTLKYAAHILKRLTDYGATDPTAEDVKRLSGSRLFDLVLSIMGEGRDKEKRKNRLNAELTAREELHPLADELIKADASLELSMLSLASGWQPFDLADVIIEDIPPIEWIVRYFLPRPSVVVFFGRPKHKKTLVVLDMCHHISAGLNWMIEPNGMNGIEVAMGRVVWVDLENGARLLKRRMKAFAKALDTDMQRGQFLAYSMPDPWLDLSKPENIPAMIERIQTLGNISVVTIDHLSQVFGNIDENSALASQVMGAIRFISEVCNIAIVLIHHAKKGAGKDSGMLEDMLRGSGAILAGCDAAFMVEKDQANPNQVMIKPVAVRGPDAPNISATFAYEQDDNLDLTSACFWRIAYRSAAARARDAIMRALQGNANLNHTQLRAEAKRIDSSLSDANIREGIATLEGTREIVFTVASKGAKIYKLKEGEGDE